MLDLDELKKQKKMMMHSVRKEFDKTKIFSRELIKLDSIVEDADNIVAALDYKFESKISINKEDMPFLFFAVALQTARQFLLRFDERTDHIKSGEKAHEIEESFFEKHFHNSDKSERFYYASMQDIKYKGVPYDVVKGSKKYNLGGGIENKGLSKTHRIKTLGHDPVLGYIFGTCNIMTATLTTNKLITVHVKAGEICNKGSTKLMFEHATQRTKDDPEALVASLIKQHLHIKSDEFSKEGIPLPFIPLVAEDVSEKLTNLKIDYANVKVAGKQFAFAELINMIITYLYGLNKIENFDSKFLEVKAAKIVEYSNVIASSSSIIATAITKDLKNLDVGGFIATAHSIIRSKKMQQNLKEEFLEKELYKLVNE